MSGSIRNSTVLFVLPANVVGGAETVTRSLLGRLEGFDVTLLTHKALAPLFEDLPLCLRFFEDWSLTHPYDYRWDNARRYARVIAECAKQTDAGLIYGVMHNAALYLALARRLHPIDMRGKRFLGSIHGNVSAHFEHAGRQASFYEKAMFWVVFHALHGLIVPSKGVGDDLVAHFGAPAQSLTVAYNGVDLEKIKQAADADASLPEKRQPWLLAATRLGVPKDPFTLVKAASLLRERDFKLIILGDGPLREELEHCIADHGIADKVILAGFQENPFPWMARADVFVHSSRFEGFPMVLIEAMAMGLPVVVTDCPSGPAESIEHGRSGYLVPVGDAQAFARRLEELLDDEDLRRKMGERARKRADTFSLRKMAEAYADCFRRYLQA